MKKIILVIGAFLLLGLILINILSEDTGTMAKDGIEINTTYLKDSEDLVADMSISGNIRKEKTLDIKTLLKEKNTISIRNDQTGSEIECVVINSNGKKVFSEIIKGDAIRSFKSLSGEGNIKLVLNSGKHDAMIYINEDELNNE
ncbi:hypothetical protein J2Y73_003304 [Peribacillus frigoritolerans]|uniref:hypothetical protein n=1 Tax=Peribacillus frigoritolerans TaxID=450367 RepID=UPI0020A19E84|nr:hypothetical protein [Peribacillus frigoritolerans]MCP1493273.1 hypothetical protein [Peribacillus frigoritolerans]